MKKIIVFLFLVSVFSCIFAKNIYYESGDTAFSFNVGVNFPLFFAFTNNQEKGFEAGTENTHLSLGGYGALSYQGFITRELAIGGEVGYMFNYARDKNLLTEIPITAKLSWYPVQLGNFDLIFHVNAGIVILKMTNSRMTAPQLTFSVNPVYYITESWGLGINCGFFTNMEIYTSAAKGSKSKENSISSFLPLTFSLIYRH